MIVPFIQGGIGNNFFQIAAAHGQANKCNDTYSIPRWKYSNYFNIPVGNPVKPPKFYNEPYYHYSEIPCQGDIELRGYFQSEKYFSHCIPIIKQLFTPKDHIKKYIDTNRPKGTLTGIHVRRNDYLKFEHYYYILGMEYYAAALATIPNPGKIMIFSDDIPWCMENIPGDYYSSGDPIQDLFLLSSCNNIIMANSSFSWWASYLSQANVIVPKLWFKPETNHDTKDLIPSGWQLV